MSNNPEDEPLGGKPILPAPSAGAQRRAHPLFTRILAESRVGDERSDQGQTDWMPSPHDEPTRIIHRSALTSPLPIEDDEAPTRSQRAFPSMRFESGRRYDQTLAFIQAMAGPLQEIENLSALPPAFGYADEDNSRVDVDELARLDALANPETQDHRQSRGEHEGWAHASVVADEAAELPPQPSLDRPPPFAPMVRPSPPPRRGPEVVDEAALASLVDTSMLIANPDGTAAFEIAFDDEVFRNLACTISVTPAGVVATFKVSDPNTRRLLEAEAGNLRVRLSERGLRVAEVRVETE